MGGNKISAKGVSPKWVKSRRRRRKRKKKKGGENNGQLRIATPPRVVHAKPPGPKYDLDKQLNPH